MLTKYDIKQMMSDIIEKFGLEHRLTIWFCELAEVLNRNQLENAYIVLMSLQLADTFVEDEEDEEPEYDDSADEVGFNPYMGSYDWDC